MSHSPVDTYQRVDRIASTGMVYTDRGSGPAVVFLHGWCLNRTLWMYQAYELLETHRVLAVDLPGFGESDGLAGPYDLDRFADAVGSFVEELALEKPLIVGFALGAAVAMRLAHRHGGLVGGLALIGPPSAQHAPYVRMARAMRRDWPDFAARSARAVCKQPQSDATLDWLTEMFRATPLPVALETVDLLSRFEPVPEADGISVRTLLVHGEQDDVVPLAISEQCVQVMGDARLEAVAGSGHLVVLDHPQHLTELIQRFASSL